MESARVEHHVCALNCNSNGRLEDTALFGACASTLSVLVQPFGLNVSPGIDAEDFQKFKLQC